MGLEPGTLHPAPLTLRLLTLRLLTSRLCPPRLLPAQTPLQASVAASLAPAEGTWWELLSGFMGTPVLYVNYPSAPERVA